MTETETENLRQIAIAIQSIKAANDTLNKRLTRIETRLTQLMVYQGMQTDGRNRINTSGANHRAY
jgi:hypothetical protein